MVDIRILSVCIIYMRKVGRFDVKFALMHVGKWHDISIMRVIKCGKTWIMLGLYTFHFVKQM